MQEIRYEIKYKIACTVKDITIGRTNIDKIITIKKIMILFKSGLRKVMILFMLLCSFPRIKIYVLF